MLKDVFSFGGLRDKIVACELWVEQAPLYRASLLKEEVIWSCIHEGS